MHQGEIKHPTNYNTIPKTPESPGLFSIHPSLHAERSFSKYFQVQYCSSKCQKEDWEQHKDFCKEKRKKRKQRREKRGKNEEEMCRGGMEALTFSEVD